MKRWLIPFTIPFVIGASYFTVFKHQTYFETNETGPSTLFSSDTNDKATQSLNITNQTKSSHRLSIYKPNLVGELAFKLRERYANHIHNIAIQSKLITFKRQLKIREKDHGDELFINVIRKAFPEYDHAILRVVQLIEIYNDWLNEHNNFRDTDEQHKQVQLWNKRHQLFGNDAEIIWESDYDGEMKKQFLLQEIIHKIDTENSTSYEEKLNHLLHDISSQVPGISKSNELSPFLHAQFFFSLESIQEHLRSLPETERKQLLSDTRRTLGFDQTQIHAFSEKDEKESIFWETGKRYNAEKKKLLQKLENKETVSHHKEELLNQLRIKYFNNQAALIKKQEQLGFERFDNLQTFGLH